MRNTFIVIQVKITDTNDHSPVFDHVDYTASVEESSAIGKRVIQVYATDRDTQLNGDIVYQLKRDPSGFFIIDSQTGWVTVARAMSGVRGSPALLTDPGPPNLLTLGGERGTSLLPPAPPSQPRFPLNPSLMLFFEFVNFRSVKGENQNNNNKIVIKK